MPGAAIAKHLADCTADSFNDIVQIFRHDVNQYAGMLHTWLALFESEISTEDMAFMQATKKLAQEIAGFHENLQAHLYPMYLPPFKHPDCVAHITAWWDGYYEDFARYLRPQLQTLETQIRAYTEMPAFAATIQADLGASIGEERIDTMIFNTYNKLLTLLEAEHFDHRVAQVIQNRQPNRS